MTAKRVLVTGLSGAVGSAIRPELEKRYEIAALSRSGVNGVPDALNFRGAVQDAAAIAPAFIGVDTVIHLAADGGAHSAGGSALPPAAAISVAGAASAGGGASGVCSRLSLGTAFGITRWRNIVDSFCTSTP